MDENLMDKIMNENISDRMENAFLDYSMSVIVARALPDVRDGLKPVHRRILYATDELGARPNVPHKKSARITGDTMGKYHPHGDSSIYDAMVRMAQDFSYRYPLIDGHGNFGSIDGDSPAAARYTEARLSKISMEMLRDINKDTIDFDKNYTNEFNEPTVLPSRFPNILVNGTMGIAVGMATNIPPHNLGEVIDGCVAYIENRDISVSELMEYVKGPDFPTYATILGNSGIKKAYETGRGTITIRSKVEIEEKNGKTSIIITELPYQVNKKSLITKIGELVRDKGIDGISDLVDESNLNGIRVVIDVKREANANVVLNNLYKQTALQTTFGINLLALVDGQPKILGLKEIIFHYIEHQKVVITRRTKYELNKAMDRAHILEGLKIALDHIDEVIKTIRSSKTDDNAKAELTAKFSLSVIQAEAILEMKLRRLTGLAKEQIEEELMEVLKLIEHLQYLLESEDHILAVVKEELLEIKDKYNDERRTTIDMTAIDYIEDESLIPVEDIVITLTDKGYIKRMVSDTYKIQNRGGVGIKGMTTNEEDFVTNMISMKTHDYILMFTNRGKVYRMKGYEIPEYSRQAKGLPIVNLIQVDKDEIVTAILNISSDEEYPYLFFATKQGVVKRTNLEDFDSIRTSGKIAISLRDDDDLIAVLKTTGHMDIMLASSGGRMVRCNESTIRVMGRTASGVRGINLGNEKCVGAEVVSDNQNILIVTEKGYGKRTPVSEYRITNRGSKGVKTLNITEKNGTIVAFMVIDDTQDVIIITNSGIIIRLPIEQITVMSRITQGVRLISLKEGQMISTVTKIDKKDGEEDDNVPRGTLNEEA